MKKAKKPGRAEVVSDILRNSQMEIHVEGDKFGMSHLLIRIHGKAAAIPSTTNNKMLWIPMKGAVLKALSGAHTSYGLARLKNLVTSLRPSIMKNPQHQYQIEALTTLFNSLRGKDEIKFDTTPKNRCAVFLMLSPELNRHDSHNIPKAACDWLAEMKVFNNDRHVDCFARRKCDAGVPGQSTDILIMRYDQAEGCVNALFSDMFQMLSRRCGESHSVQQGLAI